MSIYFCVFFWHLGIHVHALSALAVGVSAKIAYDKYAEYRTEKELVIWDYVKKHPKDFPEVFNRN